MLSSDLSWHFFARENRVYKTWFIYRVLETQFSHDVSIHVEDNWSVGATWKLSLRDSVSNRGFSKIKHLNASHSRTYLSTLCHSLSLSRLSSPLSVILPSHASITLPPSHSLHPLMLAFLLPPTVAPRHPLMLTPLSLSQLSHSPSPLSVSLHSQAPSPPVSQFSQVWFCSCVIFSCGFVVFVPKLWLIWLFHVLLCLVPKKMREKFILNFVLRLVFVFVVYFEFQVMD